MKMKIYLVTGNRHKVDEVSSVLAGYDIDVGQIDDEKFEGKEMDLEQVARYNAGKFFEKYKKPVVVDDTGVFFSAFPGFPGNHPKLMFELLGYVVREEDYATGLRQQKALATGARAEVLFGRNEGGGQRFHRFLDRALGLDDEELARELHKETK